MTYRPNSGKTIFASQSPRRVRRRLEAAERQARWDDMSFSERFAAKAERGYLYDPNGPAKIK